MENKAPRLSIPSYELALRRVIDEVMTGLASTDPIMGNLQIRSTGHAGPSRNVPGPNPIDHELTEFIETLVIHADVIRDTDIEAFLLSILELSKKHEEQLGRAFVRTISDVAEAVGNVVDAEGQPLTWDLLLDSMELVDVSFDEEGHASNQQIMVNPETARLLKAIPSTINDVRTTLRDESGKLGLLRNVLDDYLNSVGERKFDSPFLSLLPAMGFQDVHLTHGTVEYGKDFIAKKLDGEHLVQYSFQSKAGSIGQSAWRTDIQGQLLESVLLSLSHPNFDRTLPHQAVLVCTGEFRGNAALSLQALNEKIKKEFKKRAIDFWGKTQLIELLIEHGLNGVHRATAAGFAEYGTFFSLYARAMQGVVTIKNIEGYSRLWRGLDLHPSRRQLWSTVESEVIAKQCCQNDLVFEAAHCRLAQLRFLCEKSYETPQSAIHDLWSNQVYCLNSLCSGYAKRFTAAWMLEKNLVKTWFGDVYVTTYAVQCSRIMELISLAYFSESAMEARKGYAILLADFVTGEPGCSHPVSDRYAVSIVLAVLVLLDTGQVDIASALLSEVTVSLCDWYEKRMGLAGIEADEESETRYLLGYPFEFINIPQRQQSFLATAVIDLAAFLGDKVLYASIVNDIKATRIYPEYFQPRNTIGSCRIEREDVLTYPAVQYQDEITEFNDLLFAEHISDESPSFRFVDEFGPFAAVALMALLRDRYFPRLWPQLVVYRPVATSLLR